MTRTLDHRRVLVVGASSGIGRAFAVRAVREGADVMVAARRESNLVEVVKEAGGGRHVLVDVTDSDACSALAETVREQLGQVDLVLVTVGMSSIARFSDVTTADWASMLAVNVIGIHQVIAALVPVLTPAGMVVVLSSEAVAHPRSALNAYAATKAALERSMDGWRQECDGVRFTTAVIGATIPSDMANNFDFSVLEWAFGDWERYGLLQEKMMDADEVADVLAGTCAVALEHPEVGLERIVVRSPSPVVGSAKAITEMVFEES